jgi:FkbM family methyltransferase
MHNKDVVKMAKSRIWHNGIELLDEILKNQFINNGGRFLGIGANVGQDWSWPLLQQGWHGVLVEPDPTACTSLIKNAKEFASQLTIINTAISARSGLSPFYLSLRSSWNSSLNLAWQNKIFSTNVHNLSKYNDDENHVYKIITNTIGFQNFIDYVGNNFDVIVIDTEGSDSEIVLSLDWKQFSQCKLLCIEHEFAEIEPHLDVIAHLYNAGFTFTDQDNAHAIYQQLKI